MEDWNPFYMNQYGGSFLDAFLDTFLTDIFQEGGGGLAWTPVLKSILGRFPVQTQNQGGKHKSHFKDT